MLEQARRLFSIQRVKTTLSINSSNILTQKRGGRVSLAFANSVSTTSMSISKSP